MKSTFLILACMFVLWIHAAAQTTYYIASNGNDSLAGTSPAQAWKTISRVNAAMPSIQAGDQLLFNRGDEFRGSLIISRSGTATANLKVGAYGSGAAPVMNAASVVSGWIDQGGNIWVADYSGSLNALNNFFINGVSQQIGRYPNANAANGGYLKIKSSTSPMNLTSDSLTALPDLTGAVAVVRAKIFILNKPVIQSKAGATINFSGTGTGYSLTPGYGFFIQQHRSTLDQQGEWFFDAAAKKIYLYSLSDPNDMVTEAPAYEDNLRASQVNYFQVSNLHFRNSNNYGMNVEKATGVLIANCVFRNMHNAIWADQVQQANVNQNNIVGTNNNAIYITGINYTSNFNIIKNTGLRAGMGNEKNNQYNAMNIVGADATAANNQIDSTGYIGIRFEGSNLQIKNNVITNFTMTKSDAGGIYSFKGFAPAKYGYGNNLVSGNIIHHAYPNMYGSLSTAVNPNYAVGIYLDNNSHNNTVTDNTVYNVQGAGFMINIGGREHLVKRNTFYNNLYGFACYPDTAAANKQNQIRENIFFSKSMYQQIGHIQALNAIKISSAGSIDSNFYSQPFEKDSAVVQTSETGYSPRVNRALTLGRLAAIGYESHGTYVNNYTSPFSINSTGPNRITAAAYSSGINIDPTLSSPSGSMLSGRYYQLRFFLKANTVATRVNISLMGAYGAAKFKSVAADTARKEVILWFSPYADVNNTTLNFALDEPGKIVRIDHVQFQELNVTSTVPTDKIRFEVNDTAALRTFNLGGLSYTDVRGTLYTGLVTMQPFTSVILMKN